MICAVSASTLRSAAAAATASVSSSCSRRARARARGARVAHSSLAGHCSPADCAAVAAARASRPARATRDDATRHRVAHDFAHLAQPFGRVEQRSQLFGVCRAAPRRAVVASARACARAPARRCSPGDASAAARNCGFASSIARTSSGFSKSRLTSGERSNAAIWSLSPNTLAAAARRPLDVVAVDAGVAYMVTTSGATPRWPTASAASEQISTIIVCR